MNPIEQYGNVVSGILASTYPKPDAVVGCEATILNGRDREPAKVVEIITRKDGKKTIGYLLQAYKWTMDSESEGYAKTIHWDQPSGEPQVFPVVTHGKLKGTVKGAYIGKANPYYDRSF